MRGKRFLGSILVIAMILSAMSVSVFAADFDPNVTATTTLTETVTISGNVTISGGGTITRAAGMTGPMFIVPAGSTLTLKNVTIDGGAVWVYEESENAPTKAESVAGRGSKNDGIVANASVIENSGNVIIGEGAVIRNNDGGVAVTAKNGSVTTINGGKILDITAGAGTAVIAGDTNTNAKIEMNAGKIAGHITGGGVFWHRGPAVVAGGEICNNYSTASAGIFRMATGNKLSVTINGGKIHHNEANGYGGVIYAYGTSKIEINGGEISDNKAVDGGVIYGSAAKNSSLVINNGLITRNYASSTAGAIHLADWWTFQMNGGEISYNETPGLGGALRQWASWGTAFNGGVVKGNVASEGEAVWMGNGLFLSGTQFEDNDIYASDYIRVDSDFAPFELSGAQTADVRGNGDYVLTAADLAKISVNSLGKFPYFDEATKHVIYVDEYVTVLKGGEQIQVKTLEEAIEVSGEGDQIVILSDVADKNLIINKDIEIVARSKARSLPVLNNVIFTVEKDAAFSLDGAKVTGLSYIFAKEPKSVAVTNCDIDAKVIEVSGTNCPPAYVLFSSSNNGSVDFTFTGNKLLATPDVTEDWYTYNHGIAGWNSIKSAVVTGNTFGSAEAPLGAAAMKLMNFVEGATVEFSNNKVYVDSKDTTWGPNAIQFYQNNSRDNNYSVKINGNNFYTAEGTAAIGVNVNGATSGATVAIGTDNKVNDEKISVSDVLVFGNGINNDASVRTYAGIGVELDANGKIIGGAFHPKSTGLVNALADGYVIEENLAGYMNVVSENRIVEEIDVVFANPVAKEGEIVYEINLVASDEDIINRLNSVDLTFAFAQGAWGKNDFEIIASNDEVAINPVDNSKYRYEFHYNGKTDVDSDTENTITIGKVKFTGYGEFSFKVDTSVEANATNVAHATKLFDNIVDTFVPDGSTGGKLDVANSTTGEVEIAVPTRELTINVAFPNAVENKGIAYQDMKVVISGGDLAEEIEIDLGSDAVETALEIFGKEDAKYVATFANDAYKVIVTDVLTVNNAYTVTVSGAGYRTARYTVTMTDNKELNFWNNVMDEKKAVEPGKASSEVTKNFLAGDIVKDNQINIYDLSAVVSYFASTSDVANGYAKYDLNRDGVIDSKDVAYVLVSWNN